MLTRVAGARRQRVASVVEAVEVAVHGLPRCANSAERLHKVGHAAPRAAHGPDAQEQAARVVFLFDEPQLREHLLHGGLASRTEPAPPWRGRRRSAQGKLAHLNGS